MTADMHMGHYQEMAEDTAIYPGAGVGSADALAYIALGLTGEAGEVANKIKKVIRDAGGVVTSKARSDLAAELGDVLWYVAMLATELNVDLSGVASGNLAKLSGRRDRGTIGGSGDDR